MPIFALRIKYLFKNYYYDSSQDRHKPSLLKHLLLELQLDSRVLLQSLTVAAALHNRNIFSLKHTVKLYGA